MWRLVGLLLLAALGWVVVLLFPNLYSPRRGSYVRLKDDTFASASEDDWRTEHRACMLHAGTLALVIDGEFTVLDGAVKRVRILGDNVACGKALWVNADALREVVPPAGAVADAELLWFLRQAEATNAQREKFWEAFHSSRDEKSLRERVGAEVTGINLEEYVRIWKASPHFWQPPPGAKLVR